LNIIQTRKRKQEPWLIIAIAPGITKIMC